MRLGMRAATGKTRWEDQFKAEVLHQVLSQSPISNLEIPNKPLTISGCCEMITSKLLSAPMLEAHNKKKIKI